jgi:hypothetical protein
VADLKDRNARQASKAILEMARWDALVPAGQLIVCLHSTNALGIRWGESGDRHEVRNRAYFRRLNPDIPDSLVDTAISGSFKPSRFIHPFEEFYTTPGNRDAEILPLFFQVVDAAASDLAADNRSGCAEDFLAFVYLTFLVIHPFIDGNGRVARHLLDYYNQALRFRLNDAWNARSPKFAVQAFHKRAFVAFYQEGAGLEPVNYRCRYSVDEVSGLLDTCADGIDRLSAYLIHQLESAKETRDFRSCTGVGTLADGIRREQGTG